MFLSVNGVWMCFWEWFKPRARRGVSKRQTHRWQALRPARDWLPIRSRLNSSGRLGCQSVSVFTLLPAGRLKNCHPAPPQEPGEWAKIPQSCWTHFLTHTRVIWSSFPSAALLLGWTYSVCSHFHYSRIWLNVLLQKRERCCSGN